MYKMIKTQYENEILKQRGIQGPTFDLYVTENTIWRNINSCCCCPIASQF